MLPGNLSEPHIQHPSHFVGLLLRGAGLPWPNYGHVVLAKPSPILFYPISSSEVSPSRKVNFSADPLLSASQTALCDGGHLKETSQHMST